MVTQVAGDGDPESPKMVTHDWVTARPICGLAITDEFASGLSLSSSSEQVGGEFAGVVTRAEDFFFFFFLNAR
jgi:hypothetical protein